MTQIALALPITDEAESADGAERRAILTGQVVSLNKASRPDGSWIMGHICSDDGPTRTRFVGINLHGVEIGCSVRLLGEWELHPKYGRQFRALEVESRLPASKAAIVKYISTNVRLCGPSRATQIVDHFGLNCLEILADEPERVCELFSGKIGEKMLEAWSEWAEGYRLNRRAQKLTVDLMGAGMTYSLARRVQQVFRKAGEAEDVVLHHPYRLVEVPGIGFKRADQIARHMGVTLDDPSRVAAGVVYALQKAMETGHSALPRDELARKARVELGAVRVEQVDEAIGRAIAAGTLVDDGGLIFFPRVVETEMYVAQTLGVFLERRRFLDSKQQELVSRIVAHSDLSDKQAGAIRMGLENGVSILTGRPGSGKTTTIKTFVRCCEALGEKVVIVAPTGKAAARASDVTGRPASTIHRLLGTDFGKQRDEPIDADVVIVDETSMLDLDVAAWLLRNINPRRTRLLFVGDKDQLPSVGHGQFFADLIGSDVIPTVELREIFRQAADSLIITNAHRLLDNKPLILNNAPGSDFLFADVTQENAVGPDGFPIPNDPTRSRREQEEALRRLGKALSFLIRQKGAIPVRDIQVMSPMRRGLLGVDNLNLELQALLNPNGEVGPEIGGRLRVRVGDRVVQTKNDYGVPGGLFNGEQGEVVAVDNKREKIVVRFDDREIALRGIQLTKLRLAWAITVHRSQGSEFPYALLLYHTAHSIMLDPSLLYTGITRAQDLFVLIGNYRAIELTQLYARRRKSARYTGLRRRLEALREGSVAVA